MRKRTIAKIMLETLLSSMLIFGNAKCLPEQDNKPKTEQVDDDDDNSQSCNYQNYFCDGKDFLTYSGMPEIFSAECGLIPARTREIGKCSVSCLQNTDCNDNLPETNDSCVENNCSFQTPPNLAPKITSTPNTNSMRENETFNYQVSAQDPENDELTYSLVNAPANMTINSTGLITWTPDDSQSNLTHNFSVEVSDNHNNKTTQNISKFVENTENLEDGWIGDFDVQGYSGGLENILVEIKNKSTNEPFSAITDANGNWSIENVPDGLYDVTISDTQSSAVYETHKPSPWRVSKEKAQGGLLSFLKKLFKIQDRGFLYDTFRRGYGDVRGWSQSPIWWINNIEQKYQNPVSESLITMVKGVIKNQVSQFYQRQIQDNEIIVDSVFPPIEEQQGKIFVYWDNNYSGGANYQYTNGNVIVKGIAHFNESLINPQSTWSQELIENLIGGGESNIYPSILNDFPDDSEQPTTLQPKDKTISEAHSSSYSRPIGNQDLGFDGYHDVDPQDVEGN